MKNLSFLLLFLLSSCTYNELPISEITICETNSPSFSDCVLPIFEESCMECHFNNNSEGIMPLTNYEEIQDKVLNGTVIESIKRSAGFMPKNGDRLSTEQILIIEKWYENGTPNN
jgi:hypothetical protein